MTLLRTLLLLLICLFSNNSNAQVWKKALDKNGIQVYTATNANSKYDYTKSIMQINGTIQKAIDVLFNFEAYPNWVPYCIASKTVKRISDSEFVYHAVLDIPFVKNRDLVIRIKKKSIGLNSFILELSHDNSMVAISKDYVRMPFYYGKYTITEKEKNILSITLENSYDPGGTIPSFLVNMSKTDSPYKMFKSLRERINL